MFSDRVLLAVIANAKSVKKVFKEKLKFGWGKAVKITNLKYGNYIDLDFLLI